MAERPDATMEAAASGDEMSDQEPLPDFPDNVCPLCEQEYGSPDKDAPDDAGTCLVQASKSGDGGYNSTTCLKCMYIKRGSFKGVVMREFLRLKHKSPALAAKFRSLRRRHVIAMVRNPRARPRHEVVDVKMYVTKTNSKYVDFSQEAEWVPVKEYFEANADAESKRKLRSAAQKKALLEKKGLKIQKDPTGVDGVLIMPESGKKKVVIGQRMATTRERQSEHTNKDAQEAEHEKNMDGLEVEGQTKEEAAAMMEEAESVEEEPEEQDKGDASDSEDSGFGLKSKPIAKKKAKAAPKKIPKRTAPAEPMSSTDGTETASSVNANGGGGSKRLLAQADSLRKSLETLTPVYFWQHSQTAASADQKVAKALDKVALLEKFEETEEVKSAKDSLKKLAESVGFWAELVARLKRVEGAIPSEVLLALKVNASSLTEHLPSQSPDCVKTFATDIGKIVLEASMSTADGENSSDIITKDERALFFKYLSLQTNQDAEKMFTLGSLAEKGYNQDHLLAIQASLFNTFVDKMRTPTTEVTLCILESLPEHCHAMDVLRFDKSEDSKAMMVLNKENTWGFTNQSGMSLAVLTDLQKMCACRYVSENEMPHNSLPESEKQELRTCISESDKFSARLNLVFRTNGTLKRLWALATQVAKSALTADQARDKSTELLEKGKVLLDALTLPEVTLNTELMAKITAVKSYQDVLINIADKDLQEQMSGLKDQIKATVEEKICPAEIMSEFTGWLSLQWQQPPESADETSLLLASSDKLKDFWSNLSIKGHLWSAFLRVESATWYQLVIILEKLEAFEKHESSKRMFAALTLRHELDQQCRKLRSNPSWAEALKGATGRLDLLTEEIGFSLLKSAAQNSGEKEAYKICQGFPHCHGKLASCFEILAKASTFKAISEERISDDIAGLAKCMGEIVAVASTDSTLLAAMLPSCGPAHKAYLDKVLDVLKIDLDDTSMKLSDWSESLARFRPILDVAEFWDESKIKEVKWMFDQSKSVDQETEKMVDLRLDMLKKVDVLKGVAAVKAGCRAHTKLTWTLTQVQYNVRKLEEHADTTAKTVSCMMCADLVINPEKNQPLLNSYRRVCAFMARKLGTSPTDLPQRLRTKIEEITSEKKPPKNNASEKAEKAAEKVPAKRQRTKK